MEPGPYPLSILAYVKTLQLTKKKEQRSIPRGIRLTLYEDTVYWLCKAIINDVYIFHYVRPRARKDDLIAKVDILEDILTESTVRSKCIKYSRESHLHPYWHDLRKTSIMMKDHIILFKKIDLTIKIIHDDNLHIIIYRGCSTIYFTTKIGGWGSYPSSEVVFKRVTEGFL